MFRKMFRPFCIIWKVRFAALPAPSMPIMLTCAFFYGLWFAISSRLTKKFRTANWRFTIWILRFGGPSIMRICWSTPSIWRMSGTIAGRPTAAKSAVSKASSGTLPKWEKSAMTRPKNWTFPNRRAACQNIFRWRKALNCWRTSRVIFTNVNTVCWPCF